MSTQSLQKPSFAFLILAALMTSFTSVSIDMLLPTLPIIAQHFHVDAINSQQVFTFFILGIFLGEIIFGPLSDVYGRKPLIICGSLSFVIGSILCATAQTYEQLLCARVLQGFGAAGPKIAVRALLRDLYSGRTLARIFSLMYGIFMIIPMSAPLIGRWLTQEIGWEGEYLVVAVFCFVSTMVFTMIQPETLAPEKRTKLHFWNICRTAGLIFAHQKVLLLTLLLGIVFGLNMTYLGTAQLMFKHYFHIEKTFPYYFAFLASAIGLAYFASAKLVDRFGGFTLCSMALGLLVICTSSLVIAAAINHGIPHFWFFLLCFYGIFLSYGILWANVAILAIEYLGAAAGLGSTFISAGASLLAFFISGSVGKLYAANFIPLGLGFTGLAVVGALCYLGVIKSKHSHSLGYESISKSHI